MSIFLGNRRHIESMNWLKASMVLFGLFAVPFTQAAEKVIYYHYDALGSPVTITDVNGTVWNQTYRPYGERIGTNLPVANNNRWYTGKPLDVETGLSYFGARYYDPIVGRFMGVDPQEFTESNPHSFNRYNYANNNPYKYIDPDGEAPILIPIIVPAVIGIGTFAYELYNPPAINPAHPDAIYPSMGPGEVLGGPLAGAGRASLIGLERLTTRSIANQIARGHAFDKHVIKEGQFRDLGIGNQKQFSDFIDNIIKNADAKSMKQLERGRTGYWDERTRTVVIRDPRSPDGGTAFRPSEGRRYFDDKLK